MTTRKTANERITLRLEKKLLDDLKRQAEEHDLPINALINKILIKNTFNETRLNVLPSISISHEMFKKIINEIDDESLKKITSVGQLVTKKYFSLINEDYTIENIVDDYFVVLAKYCGWYQFHFEKKDTSYRLIFESDLGVNWTKFLSIYIKSILLKCKVHINSESIEDNIVIIEITKL